MSGNLSIRTNLLSPVSPQSVCLLQDHIIHIAEDRIAGINPWAAGLPYDIDLRNCLAIPGLIDTHVHLSQHRISGLFRESLLPWLNEIVFPEENKSADYDFAYALAEDFFQSLYKAGTTTAVIYTAPYPVACEAAFEVAGLHDFRAIIGMTLMNQNSPDSLLQDTEQVKTDCLSLIDTYHRPEHGLEYIFTPRFAPSCSMELMQWIGRYAGENDIRIQTHLSENKDEIKWVQDLFGLSSYTEVYRKAGILTGRTILAHCIHLSDEELETIKAYGCKVSHCPDSNFFLRSGLFPLDRIRDRDIPFALGSDVGAGTTLNMLYHAKMYHYRQSQTPVTPADAFYRITLGAAVLLNLDNKIGSLESGKEADIVLLNLPETDKPLSEDILSRLVFTGHEWNVAQVYSKGVRKV
jgi:guanine deaminase